MSVIEDNDIKKIVLKHYKEIADNKGCCCGCGGSVEQISSSIGYTNEAIQVAPEANLGLGCGNPTAFGEIREGDVVVDLGSGTGFDCFLAAKKVGKHGKVIGVDMTKEMIENSKTFAKKYDFDNVEFRVGEIDNLPIETDSVDVIISNCVINLVPDKSKVFREAYRVMKNGGKMFISDIVLLKELSDEQRKNGELISCCVGGALLKNDYLKMVNEAGFKVRIISEDTKISTRQYWGIPLESLKIEACK